ncbi:MAG: ABC transporter substrate-binding protein [Candidatus Rokubacteria bacterium]|nr:ABC transporter substrate-binding protein [Candidatus Rokubacteria bacterium]
MRRILRSLRVLSLILLVLGAPAAASAAPEGQMVWAVHISLAPVYFEPAEAPGIITPFMLYYALHDALVKPMPGNAMTPSLAESWAAAPDGLSYEFVLRKGVKFHNGDQLTADDVKFSFERYRGVASKSFKERVAAVEIVDPHRVRFRLKQPWPDFMTFYGTPATGAGWIVPKKYVEKVGDDGFKKAPVGAGPYRFVSFTPGVEVVVEAFEGYWRKTPSVKRLVFKSVPEESTRLAMLKRTEADVADSIRGALAEELKRTAGLTLKPTYMPWTQWMQFTREQWDAKSPWADRRVRLAANLAMDRKGINDAEFLGLSRVTASIIPHSFDFYWSAPQYPYDPAKARQLLAEAGYPNGFDGGVISSDMVYSSLAEAIANYFGAVGIRLRVTPMERAAILKANQEKKLVGLNVGGSAAFGNAATRIEAYVGPGGLYVYGNHPDIDDRYNIVSEDDLRMAAHQTTMYVDALPTKRIEP